MSFRFESNVAGVKAAMRGTVKEALADIAADLLGKSVEVTPKDTGDLRASGHPEVTQRGTITEAKVGFGESYAVTVHEDLSRVYREPGTGPKYLERPYLENKERYEEELARALAGMGDG